MQIRDKIFLFFLFLFSLEISALAGVDLSQGANGKSTAPISPVEWVGGNLGSSKGHFVEGFSIPYRAVLTGLTNGPHYLRIKWDTRKNTKNALDYITHYDRLLPHNQFGAHTTPEVIDPLGGLTNAFGSPTTFPIPAPSSAGSPTPGQPTASFNSLSAAERLMTIYNGTITSIGYTSEESLSLDTASTIISVNFIATTSTVVIAWGGHLASEFDWGNGNSASSITGSPYHTSIDSLDGGTGSGDLSLSTDAVVSPPTCGIIAPRACPGATNIYEVQTDADSTATINWSLINNTSGSTIVGASTNRQVQVALGNTGSFSIRVTITLGQVNSTCEEFASIVPTTATALTPVSVCAGGPAFFSTVASGIAPITFLWKKDGTVLAGQTNNFLSISNTTAADNGNYCVIVSGCNNITNCATLTVITNIAAISPITNQTKCSGDNFTFNEIVSANGTLQYIWKKNGQTISGQTNNSFTIASLSTNDAGTYSVEVFGECNSITNSAVLTVNLGTEITPLSDANKCPGESVVFQTTVFGSGPFSFTWEKNGNLIFGETNNSLTINSVSGTNSGNYTVHVSGSCNTVSSSANLTVNENVSITPLQPETKCFGESAVFSPTVSGTGPFTFAWKLDGNSISTNQSDLTIDTAEFTPGDHVVQIIVNGLCSSATNETALTIQSPTTTSALSPLAICQGAIANFSISASGTAPFSYAWKLDDVAIGTNGESIAIETASLNVGEHTVSIVVNGACGSVTNQTTLTVNPSPTYSIAGTNRVCPNSTGNIFSAPSNLVSYAWTISGNGNLSSPTNEQTATIDATSAGDFTLSLFTTDTNGCNSVSQLVVVVGDTNPPAINCSSNLVFAADIGQCTKSNVTFSVTAFDDCGAVDVICVPPSGSEFPIGITTVNCVATDASGNTKVCSFTVTVNDAEPPQLICPADLVLCPDAGQTSRSNVIFSATAGDNCPGTIVTFSPPSGSTFAQGVTPVICTATDAAGNTNACSFNVTITESLSVQPLVSLTNCLNSSATFTAIASGSGPVSYLWSKNNLLLPNQTNNSLTISNVSSDDAGIYQVEVSGFCNAVTNSATLTVNSPTTATPLVGLIKCSGEDATFTTTASGTGPFNYVWKKDDLELPGETNNSLTITSITPEHAGNYSVEVNGFCNSATNVASLVVNSPTTASELSTLVKCIGEAATFNTLPSGTGPFSYVWKKDNSTLEGETNSSLNIATVTGDSAGIYSVIVSGTCNSVTNQATLTLNSNTTASALSNITKCLGETAQFSTTVSGTPPFNFVWKKDGSVKTGETNSFLTLTNLTATDEGTYTVEVSGACDSVTNSAELIVNTPTVATILSNQTKCVGANVTFSTVASGSGPFTFLWKKDGNELTGRTNNFLALTNLTLGDAGTYSVEVGGVCNSVTNIASLIVNSNLSITPLVSRTACSGDTVTFSTTAIGTGPFIYAWRKNGTLIDGQTNNSLTLSSVTSSNAGTYTIEVAGACNNATNSATLSIGGLITATALTNQTICSCQAAIFSTTPSGIGPFSFIWKKGSEVIPSQTTNVLVLQNLKTNDSGTYSVTVIGSCNSVTNSATLTIIPEIVANPASFTNSTRIVINDASKATPYPSVININCLFGIVRKVRPTLYGFSHDFPTDVDVLLAGPSGKALKLLSDVGNGSPATNLTFSFDDLFPPLPHTELVSGTFRPTDYSNSGSLPTPAPSVNATNLAVYSAAQANGAWSLFVVDDSIFDDGFISGGWSLAIEHDDVVPVLSNPKILGAGKFQFVLTGEPTVTHIIEASSDLENWVPISTNTLVGPTLIFIDSNATNDYYQFYRAVRPR